MTAAVATSDSSSVRFRLDVFEGPLDLLLHLIKRHEIDLYDIPIARITDQYLEYLGAIEELNLDVAGEYLVMAALLVQIKARMLLPPDDLEEGDEEEEDPRAELVQQLEEYRRYREAAAELGDRDLLDRDVFRRERSAKAGTDGERPLAKHELQDLVDALMEVLRRVPERTPHEVERESVSVSERSQAIVALLRGGGRREFREMCGEGTSRLFVVATFLALLELIRRRVIVARQEDRFGPILLELDEKGLEGSGVEIEDEYHE